MLKSAMDLKEDDDDAAGPGQELLSDDEKRLLDLYDDLRRLELERALLTARADFRTSMESSTATTIEQAQNALLESRAKYVLRNDVTDSVISANPIIQAVHGSINASPVAKDILPLIKERDSSSTTLAGQTAAMRSILDELTTVSAQSLRLSRENVHLAAEVLELAKEAEKDKDEALADPETAERIAALVVDMKASRRRWRVMKGTASGVVAGSGIDWARDEELRALVMDDDEDDEVK